MSQLLLDLSLARVPSLENFVVGRNAELLYQLRAALESGEGLFYLWGEPGSGCSHLLQAMVPAAQQRGLAAEYTVASVPDAAALVAVDEVQRCDAHTQIALFNLYNHMREQGGVLLVAGNAAPAQLALRDDLRTRLGWGLVYQLHSLSDPEKAHALHQYAHSKGYALPHEVVQYLLTHGRRDLPSLLATLDALDQRSLSLHRAPSIPLLKQVMPVPH